MTEECLICAAPLKYLESAEPMVCEICGKVFESNARCCAGHFVCDTCHASPGIAVSTYICSHTLSKNPVEIAVTIMESPHVHMHGPEHHVIVGQALLAAYNNAGGDAALSLGLHTVAVRGKQIPGGFCGFAGSCGSAVSAGIFLCVALGTTPLSGENWALGMRLTAACLNAIANFGGPRCCKRDAFTSILTAAEFVKENTGILMEIPEKVVCCFSFRNAQCLKWMCPYFSTSPYS